MELSAQGCPFGFITTSILLNGEDGVIQAGFFVLIDDLQLTNNISLGNWFCFLILYAL